MAGWKRWNHQGTPIAKQHMGELRDRKARLATTEAAREWCDRHGVPFDRAWLQAAIAAGYPHGKGLSPAEKTAWFRGH